MSADGEQRIKCCTLGALNEALRRIRASPYYYYYYYFYFLFFFIINIIIIMIMQRLTRHVSVIG